MRSRIIKQMLEGFYFDWYKQVWLMVLILGWNAHFTSHGWCEELDTITRNRELHRSQSRCGTVIRKTWYQWREKIDIERWDLFIRTRKLKTKLYWNEKKILFYVIQTVFFLLLPGALFRKTNDHSCKIEFLQIKDTGK